MSSHIPQIRNPNQGLDWEMPGGRDLCRARPPRAGRLPCRTRGGRGCQPGREAVPVSCNSSHKYVSQAGRGVQPRTRRALSVPLGLPGRDRRQLEVERCPPFLLPSLPGPAAGPGGVVGRRVLLPEGGMGVRSRRPSPRVNSPAPSPRETAGSTWHPRPSPRGVCLRNGHHGVGEKRTVRFHVSG